MVPTPSADRALSLSHPHSLQLLSFLIHQLPQWFRVKPAQVFPLRMETRDSGCVGNSSEAIPIYIVILCDECILFCGAFIWLSYLHREILLWEHSIPSTSDFLCSMGPIISMENVLCPVDPIICWTLCSVARAQKIPQLLSWRHLLLSQAHIFSGGSFPGLWRDLLI